MTEQRELYHETRGDLRIVELRSGEWQAQRKAGGKQQEGWLNVGRPGNMEHAWRHVYRLALNVA